MNVATSPLPLSAGGATWLCRLAVAAALTAAACAAAAQEPVTSGAAVNEPRAGSGDRIESVTVTARRRNEDSQSVPIPITALGGDALEASGQFRLEELNQKLPSTNVQFSNPRQTSIAVRGLGNNPANDALESSVGVYLDNVYLGRPGMANLDLIDIQQIELLRGPQGTLFGKNTTAGVLNISTREPTFTPDAQAEVSYGNYDFLQWRGAVSGPIVDEKLAGRISVVSSSKSGYIDDLTDGRKLNGYDREGARGQLLFTPDEDVTVRVIADYNEEHSECCASVLYGVGPNNGALYFSRVAAAGAHAVYDPDYRSSTINDRQAMDVRQGGGSAEVNWKIGDYQLTSISAYRSWWFTPTNDADSLDVAAIRNAGQRVDDEQWSQEIRVASPTGGAVDWVAGAFYFYQTQDNVFFTQYGPDATAYVGNPVLNNGYTQTRQALRTESTALFAQATWHVTDRFDLTAGVRGTTETKRTHVRRDPGIGSAGFQTSFAAFDSGALKLNDDNPSGLLSASWRLSDDVLLYSSVAYGAKSGGINPSVPNPGLTVDALFIDAERAEDIELGIKTSWFDRRLTANANLYWTSIEDYQATLLLPISEGVFQQILSNVGRVRSRGVEVEVAAVPVTGLTFNLTTSFNDTEYLSYTNAPCAAEDVALGAVVCDLSGEAVVGAPRWVVNPSVAYETTAGTELTFRAVADYAWRSDFNGSFDNSEFAKIDGYGLLNLRAGVGGDVGGNQWEFTVWAQNALHEHYVIGGIGLGQFRTYSLSPGQPRTVGATFRLNF